MKTPNSADCPVFLENLNRYLDGVMQDKEKQEFLNSIENHMECIDQLEKQKAYKQFLLVKVERKCCSDQLISTIKSSIKKS